MILRIAIPALLAAVAMHARAGTVLEMTERDLDARRPESKTTTYAQDGRIRVEMPANGAVLIFKEDALYMLQTREKRYTVMDRKTLQQLAGQLAPARKDLQAALSRLPPDQRATMERLLAGTPQPKPPARREVRATSRTDRVRGYACTYSEVREQGALSAELCVARASAVQGADEWIRSATRMNALLEEMQASLGGLAGFHAPAGSEEYAKLGGLPVLARQYRAGKVVHETRLESIRTENLDAETFAVPAGYSKTTLPR